MKLGCAFIAGIVLASSVTAAQSRTSVLFIGNSFTYAHASPVRFYRSGTVTDLNGEGIGGVPALFKSFTQQAGLDYDVSLETRGGVGLEPDDEGAVATPAPLPRAVSPSERIASSGVGRSAA